SLVWDSAGRRCKTVAKKITESTSAQQIAQKAKPNWRPVPRESAESLTDAYLTAKPDAQTPELDALMRKYFGDTAENYRAEAKKPAPPQKSELVVMEPKNASDARPVGRKRVLVEDGKVVGEQG